MPDPVILDGRQGEGGGQVLRSGLALSVITGRPFELNHIRGGRKKPGLMRQHLACVRAAAEISGGAVEGAELGSSRMRLDPGTLRAGSYRFPVGSAGSCNLVLQTVLMPLLLADAPSELLLEGGTHNSMAPPFDALERSFLPLLERMGAQVKIELESAGFYPAGGGRVRVHIQPLKDPKPLTLLERGPDGRREAIIDVAHLGDTIPKKQAKLLVRMLPLLGDQISIREHENSPGPGNAVTILLGFRDITEAFTGFGQRGLPSNRLIHTLTKAVKRYLAQDAPVGSHLADQLLLPMAVLAGGSFRTVPPTDHTTTNAGVIGDFLGEDSVGVEADGAGTSLIRVRGRS